MHDGRTAPLISHRIRSRLLGAFAIGAVSVALINGLHAAGPDFLQFWSIGRAMPIPSYGTLHNEAIPLTPALRADPAIQRAIAAGNHDLYLTATPLFYAIFASVVGPDFVRALTVFQIVSLTLFVGGLIVMLRQWGYSWDGVCLAIIGCCLFCAPLYDDTWQANVSRIYVALMAAVLWMFRRRDPIVRSIVASACLALLALLVLFKPLAALAVGVLLLWQLATRQWRGLAYDVTGLGAGTLLGLLLPSWLAGTPLTLWRDFVRIQTHYVDDGEYQMAAIGDASFIESIAGALHMSVMQLVAILALAGLCVAIVVLVRVSRAAARSRARSASAAAGAGSAAATAAAATMAAADARQDSDAADLSVTLGAAGFLVVSPLVWPHYYLLSIVLALYLLGGLIQGDGSGSGDAGRDGDGGGGGGGAHGGGRRGAGDAKDMVRRLQMGALVVALILLAGNPLAPLTALRHSGARVEQISIVDGQLGIGNILVCGIGALEYGRRLRRRARAVSSTLKVV